jgi:ferredoxin
MDRSEEKTMGQRLEDHPTVKRYHEMLANRDPSIDREPLEASWLRDAALESGADDAGFVEIQREELADQKLDILSIFPETQALVSFVIRLNPENIRSVSRAVSDLEYKEGFHEADRVARALSDRLRQKGVHSCYFASGFPMNLENWPGKMWSVSHKPIAVAAGLGHLGLHRILIHPVFGSFIVLSTLLMDRAVSHYGSPLDFNPCIDCKLCVAACPVGAISGDGHFNFVNCLTHNYRDRLGGFSDWVESITESRGRKDYRKRVSDPETVSMWQSLSYGICNKSSYCMAACPAGDERIGRYLLDRKGYVSRVLKPLQDKEETIYALPGSDAVVHVSKHFPRKTVKQVRNGIRAQSVQAFLTSLPLLFQRDQSKGLRATYHFTFTGKETLEGTVVIRDGALETAEGLSGKPDLRLVADSETWLKFLAKEENLPWALLRRRIRIKGSPKLMRAFARCFAA